jgi:hypothetical protein
MSLVWHIVIKDLKRSWPAALAWAGAAAATVAAHSIPSEAPRLAPSSLALNGGLFLLTTFLCYNVFVQLLLNDPLCLPGAFWITRPISGWRLFSAKLLGCALLSALTLLVVTAVATIASGGTLSHGLLAAKPALIWVAFPCVAAFVVSAISRTTRECLLISFLGCALLSGLSIALQNSRTFGPATMDLRSARAALGGVLALGFSLSLVLNQFLTRNRSRSLMLGVVGAITILLASLAWPYSWPEPQTEPQKDAGAFSDVRISSIQLSPSIPSRQVARTKLQVDGLPPQTVATVLPSKYNYTLGENALPISYWIEGSALSVEHGLSVLNVIPNPHPAGTTLCETHDVVPAEVLNNDLARVQVLAAIALWRCDITREIPVKAGTETRDGPVNIRIAESSREASVLELSLTAPRPTEETLTQFAVVNRRLNRQALPRSSNYAVTPFSGVHRYRLAFRVKESDDDFWRDATLVEVTFRRIAVVHRTAETTKQLRQQ